MSIGAPTYRDSNVETLTGATTLTHNSARFQSLDPGGAGRVITLPADAQGLMCTIKNTADNAEDLTINDAANALVGTISRDELGELFNDGTDWHMGIGTET